MAYTPVGEDGVVWTPTCLIRWPNVFEPTVPKGAASDKKPQYNLMAVLSGHEPVYALFRNALWAEMDRACVQAHNADIKTMQSRGRLRLAARRNNDPETGKQNKPGFAERPDGIHFTASTLFAFPVWRGDNNMPIGKEDADLIYDGIFGQVGVTAWGWSHPTGGKGISLNLCALIRRKGGTRLGGASIDMASVPNDDYVPEGAVDDDDAAAPRASAPADGGGHAPSTPTGDQYGF